jgi:hypothetical protein
MITHRFAINARIDLENAVHFYNDQRRGLGYEFAVEVGLALSKVLAAPNTWPEIEPGFHRYRLSRFPYGVFYRVLNPRLGEIVAIFDLRAEPGSWRRNVT